MAKWQIWIDTGGTFTDCIAKDPDGIFHKTKVLSNSALRGRIKSKVSDTQFLVSQSWEAPSDFIRGFALNILNREHGKITVKEFDAEASLITTDAEGSQPDDIEGANFEVISREESPVLACRLLTRSLTHDSLPKLRLRLATTKGTNALLENKGAPVMLLTTRGFGDLLTIGDQKRPDLFSKQVCKPPPPYSKVLEVPERTDAAGNVHFPLDADALEQQVKAFLKQDNASFAICLMHSYKNEVHEEELVEWLQSLGARYISISSRLNPFMKILSRAQTTVINAFLQPVLHKYMDTVKKDIQNGTLHVMTSAGGLVRESNFHPKDSLLSGPAAGVVGASSIGRQNGFERIISFDMGGTSTDVSRYDNGFDYTFEQRVGNAILNAPALSIETVAAGGGSICAFDGNKLTVRPESAGASPGPACYGAGGPLTLTDVNLLLGRLEEHNFSIPLSPEKSRQKFLDLLEDIEKKTGEETDQKQILEGFLQIANERMADAIRKISMRKGYDPSEYALVGFGGAGAQHICAIADELSIENILIPADAGLLSAYGLGNAVVERFAERQVLKPLKKMEQNLGSMMQYLRDEAKEELRVKEGISDEIIIRKQLVFMRLKGQDSTIEVEYGEQMYEAFKNAYQKRYGHWIEGAEIEVESVRVVASTPQPVFETTSGISYDEAPRPEKKKKIQFLGSRVETPVFIRKELPPEHTIKGPALVLDPYCTIVVEPGWQAIVQNDATLRLNKAKYNHRPAGGHDTEAVALELFTNRFTAITGEMGEMLKRTALSVNVKERMDFSCALLNPGGELVVNAPHIPVHLGALGLCVRKLTESIRMRPGDVVVTNHPAYGGSHLPDVTVVTPVFTNSGQLLGYTASRAHHAEIGGSRPGSMPPDAGTLAEEGVVIPPMYLVEEGREQWSGIKRQLAQSRYPTRSIEENMADLQAAVAANHRGAELLRTLAESSGVNEVHKYMDKIKEEASQKSRIMLQQLPDGEVLSQEYLDDGSLLKAVITKKSDTLTIDFTGTAATHPGNLNATPAIVNSVVMYVLRLLINRPLPLNEGLLEPVTIILPECMLNPVFSDDASESPAVVGGNTETSQRLVDLLLKPFEVVACSQGTMNNVLFGNDHFGYYETIGGGTGAGPGFEGTDAVHHHMTNTAGTDPEILEHRYPVMLDRYSIRKGSGGSGRNKGGDGIVREMTFLKPVSLSVLTQHRKERPYGLQGGKPGSAGRQWVIKKNGSRQELSSIDGCELQAGDRFVIHTPGGGGFGKE